MPGVVGIDAGGSHTRALRVTADGTVMAEGHAGPANTFFTDVADARRHVEEAAAAVLHGDSPPQAGCVAGPHLPEDILQRLEAASPSTQWVVVTEATACRAAIFHDADAPGVIVQCGTGTSAEGRWPNGQRVRRGGWGPVVGDEGSGTMIAVEALRAVVRAAEEMGPRTALTDNLLDACGVQQVQQLKTVLYRPLISRARLAALCPVVALTAAAGDAVAQAILTAAGRAVAELAAAVLLAPEAPGPTIPTAFFGGVVQNVPEVYDACLVHLRDRVPQSDVQRTPLLPVDGAIAVAFQTAMADAGPALRRMTERRRAEQGVAV